MLETYPRDELFQADEDELFDIALGVLRLQEHQRTRLFVRRDRFDRFVSCLVFVPRDKYNTDLRRRIAESAGRGVQRRERRVHAAAVGVDARAHSLHRARREPGAMPEVDTRELEARLVQVARRWQDDLADALIDATARSRATACCNAMPIRFPPGYRDDYPARTAVRDIELIERDAGAASGSR